MFQETEISDEREFKNRAKNKWKGREYENVDKNKDCMKSIREKPNIQ